MQDMGRAATAALLTLVAIALIASNAEAQNAAQAERHFNEAKALFDAGKTREACEAWEASQRLDPSLGTLTNVANCREKANDLATAWEAWISVERQTAGVGKYENLNNTAKTRAAALEPRLSYLTINVPDEVRIEGLVVLRDGVQIDPGAWNRALPIDGGKHMISGRAPGHETWSTTVEMQPEADKQSVEVPRFKAIRNPTGGKTVVIEHTQPSMFTPRRKIAVGVAAGGVVAIAAGAFLGMRARSLADDAEARCPDNDECTLNDVAAAEDLSHDAHRTAQFADVAFGVGIAAIGTGAFLWLTSKPAPRATAAETPTPTLSIEPRIAPTYAGVSAAVRF
jgi:hypothetical protein